LSAINFTPKAVYESTKAELPEFSIPYKPDFRQRIAASGPSSIADRVARSDWNWKENHNLKTITTELLKQLKKKYQSQNGYFK
jgi:hypothetical protein